MTLHAAPDPPPMETNRPDYAPQRRPGDPTDPITRAWDLVTLHTDHRDAETIAALIEAGAAALELAPRTSAADLNARVRAVQLGRQAAHALNAEAERIAERHQHRHQQAEQRAKAEERQRERDATQLEQLRQRRLAGTPPHQQQLADHIDPPTGDTP